jgi:large subunit ribosomal protein L25
MELKAQRREIFGKAVRRLRAQGLIPAELYGHGIENVHLSVSAKEFLDVFKKAGENTVLDVVLEGKRLPALIVDASRHPISGEILSVDLYQVRMDEKIRAKIPLEFVGESPAVKEQDGVIAKSMHEIEVEALPGDLPHNIQVDLSALKELDMSIYVKDLSIPSKVKVLVDADTVVVSVIKKMAEEVPSEAAQPTVESVVVETEEKKAERQAKKAEKSED